MTAPIDMAAYQFDFLPWYTPLDGALALFGLDKADYRRTDTVAGCVIEFAYPSALGGGDARVQLIFERLHIDRETSVVALTGVRTIETFDDMDGLLGYIAAAGERFADMASRKALSMAARSLPGSWAGMADELAGGAGVCRFDHLFGAFTGPDGAERYADMRGCAGAADAYREYLPDDRPYFAMYGYILDPDAVG